MRDRERVALRIENLASVRLGDRRVADEHDHTSRIYKKMGRIKYSVIDCCMAYSTLLRRIQRRIQQCPKNARFL